MSADDDNNQNNEVQLGSLQQYDSGDLNEILKKFQKENGNTDKEALRSALHNMSGQQQQQAQGIHPETGFLDQLAAVASNPGLNQLSQVHKTEPYLEILEQPKSKGIRFRYKCEGRSAGSIPGETSNNEHKTFPSVRINNFKGPAAIVVVSCVTKDEPYQPHPHTLVGKECRKGVCTIKLKRSNVATFPNLGIQCVTKKEIKDSLKEREQIRVDPFGTGYYEGLSKLHLNIVRLCFQAFLPDDAGQYTRIVPPVVSQPIFDKKAVNDLVICRLSKQSGHAKGGDEVFMLCEKVSKDDIQVRFFEEVDDETMWDAFADFSQSDVHRQYAIVFKTPPYKDQSISRPVEVYMQLFRPSDEGASEPKVFQYIPNDPDPEGLDRKRKRQINYKHLVQDSNPNTPAFSLLTDNIKDESEQKNPTSASVREKLKARTIQKQKPPISGGAFSQGDTVHYTQTVVASAASGLSTTIPVSFQSPINQLETNEVVIQTTNLGPMQNATFNVASALTELGNVQTNQGIKAEPQSKVTVIAPKAAAGTDDSDDIMLEDLQVTDMLRDNPQADELPSLPSLSQLPSFGMGTGDIPTLPPGGQP